MAARRVNWWVRWRKRDRRWCIYEGRQLHSARRTKVEAVKSAVLRIAVMGRLAELFILRKDGKIGRGSSGRRTYGKDPRGRG